MGIRFYCPKGHKLNVKQFQAGRKGICPYCGAKIQIPTESTRPSSKKKKQPGEKPAETAPAPSGATGVSAADLAPGGGVPAAVGSPGFQPASAAAGADDVPTVDFPGQGPAAGSPLGVPAVGAAPLPSPAVAPQGPSAGPAVVAPTAPAAPGPGASGTPSTSPAADPLTDAGDVVWYVRPASGGQFGPASSEVMRSWLEQGRVGVDSLVWREGWPDWRQAAKVFPQLETGPPNPAPGSITSPEVPASSATAARSRRAKSIQQSKKTQAVVIILLIFVVITLFGVLLWVLFA